MPNKLTAFILTVILSISVICSSTASAGLLDGTTWIYADRYSQLHMAFYEDQMYIRDTARTTWTQSVLPYLSYTTLNGSITYINYFPDFLFPSLMWGRCNIDNGIGSYNVIGMLFYAIPLFDHKKPCELRRTNWTPPKTAEAIDSFPSPYHSPEGLAFDGTYLWHTDLWSDKIYKLDISGNIIESFDSPGNLSTGLVFDGTYLWLSDPGGRDSQGKLYKLDTSGNVIDSFDSPGPNPKGLAFDGTYLWNADFDEEKIYKLDISGNIIDSFDAPGGLPYGLTFDGTYLWTTPGVELLIYKIDLSGNVIESFYSPATFDPHNIFDFPTGLAWDGQYLWVAYAAEEDSIIYKYDVSEGK